MSRTNPDPHLLPSNALSAERALSLAVSIGDDLLPEDVKTLWRPRAMAARFLPFAAWGMHLDFWRDTLGDDVKRRLILDSFAWHRKKGTVWAVRTMLERLGFVPTIKEWFDIGTKAHTFSVTGYYREDPNNLFFLGQDTEKTLIEALFMAKPERSHLIFLTVAPPLPDMGDHICRWDWCTWDHGVSATYVWELVPPFVGVLPNAADMGATSHRVATGEYAREDRWDVDSWDVGRYIGMLDTMPRTTYVARRCDWREYAPRPKWSKSRSWRCGSTWNTSSDRAAVAEVHFKEVD